jgi:hypothetical protein
MESSWRVIGRPPRVSRMTLTWPHQNVRGSDDSEYTLAAHFVVLAPDTHSRVRLHAENVTVSSADTSEPAIRVTLLGTGRPSLGRPSGHD